MSYGKASWSGNWILEDEDTVMTLLKKAYDVGIRTYDTADIYSNGESERLLGRFLKKYNIPRSTVVILTKVFYMANDPNGTTDNLGFETEERINRMGLSRKHIMDAVDESMERLGTYIDLYQIHRFDKNTPIEETMKALHDCVQAGKVRYIGASSMRATQFAQMQFVAEKNGWTKFVSMQNLYNLIYREEEREMIPYCKETGVGLIPWSPVARGMLARPAANKESARAQTDKVTEMMGMGEDAVNNEIVGRVEQVAKKRGVSMAIIALAWVLAKGACPIVGFNKVERIDEAVRALEVKLTEEEIKFLEEPYVPKPVSGFDPS
ncbi:putative aryl-alcohol dehydrogenase Aad16p [Trichomonascus vanleenenianus]|uniref:aldo/keto reductase n=1 Tax=Trichomonascus vanleenenianus TaxID=2268995 RepID=UPI003EC9D0EC